MSNIGTKFILAQRFIFDPNSNLLIDQVNDNENVRLGSNESRILLMLSERPNQIISRQELHEFVWREQGFEVDDSSLTQAISTLRKMLHDSTKSPLFVKTVPKRGYQFIASVERSAMYTSSADVNQVETSSGDEINDEVIVTQPHAEVSSVELPNDDVATKVRSSFSIKQVLSFFMLIIACALPLIVILGTHATPTQFKQLTQFDGVPIKTLQNHPDINAWLPSIKNCIVKYKQLRRDTQLPFEVIVTGGQTDQIVLNYVYSATQAKHNVSIHIYTNHPELKSVCN